MKKNIGVRGIVCLVMAAGILFPVTSHAQILSKELPNREGIEIGNIILHAALTTGVDFESNIFLQETSEEYDSITRIKPSIGIEVPLEDNRFSVEYDPEISIFERFSEQDHVDHRIRGLLQIYLTDFEITLSDTYRRFTNRAGSDETGLSGNRTREHRNDAVLSVGAEFDQLEYLFMYANRMRKFLRKNQLLFGPLNYDDQNHMYNEVGLEVDYRFRPKTTFLFETVLGHLNYFSSLSPDSYYIESLLGIKAEWFNRFIINLRCGAKFQEYGSSDFIANDNFFNFVCRGGVDIEFNRDEITGDAKDTFRFNLVRTNYDSIYKIMNYYEGNFASIDYIHRFNRKLMSDLFFSWQFNQYPKQTTEGGVTGKRRDVVYRTGALFRYDLSNWCSIETGYIYRKRDSKFTTFDYTDHVTQVRATVGF